MTRAAPPRQQRGYSLIEVSVVVGVLGVLTFAVTSGMENMQKFREHRIASADAESARNAIRAFVLSNKRLPCPAASDSYREADFPCSRDAGWLPYESLGLQPPPQRTRMKYGIYLSAAANLAAPTPQASDGLDPERTGGLLVALSAAARANGSTSSPHYSVAGDQATTIGCPGGAVVNPAFVIIAPASDLAGNSNYFESPHDRFGSGSKCVTSPAHRVNAGMDDIVVAESANSLLGWFSNSTR